MFSPSQPGLLVYKIITSLYSGGGRQGGGNPGVMGGGRREDGRLDTQGGGSWKKCENFQTLRNNSQCGKHTKAGTNTEGAGTGNTVSGYRKREVEAPCSRVTQPSLTSVSNCDSICVLTAEAEQPREYVFLATIIIILTGKFFKIFEHLWTILAVFIAFY